MTRLNALDVARKIHELQPVRVADVARALDTSYAATFWAVTWLLRNGYVAIDAHHHLEVTRIDAAPKRVVYLMIDHLGETVRVQNLIPSDVTFLTRNGWTLLGAET